MRSLLMLSCCVFGLAACEGNIPPSVKNHPDKQMVNIDDHKIYVIKQAGNQWVASGGEEDQDGFVEYRQQRAVEVQSKCRVQKVLSPKGAPLLRVAVHQCRA